MSGRTRNNVQVLGTGLATMYFALGKRFHTGDGRIMKLKTRDVAPHRS